MNKIQEYMHHIRERAKLEMNSRIEVDCTHNHSLKNRKVIGLLSTSVFGEPEITLSHLGDSVAVVHLDIQQMKTIVEWFNNLLRQESENA